MHPVHDTDETHDTGRTPERVVPLKNPPSLKPLTLTQRAVVEALASGAQTQTEAAQQAGVSRSAVQATSKSPQLADVYEATLRECGLSAANIKRRLWLLSHDAADAGQFAPAVSAVVALHRDVERMEQGTTVNVQVIRIGGKDVYF